jgi:HSP20 family protein
MRNLTQWTPRNRLEVSDPFRSMQDIMDVLWNTWPSRLGEVSRTIQHPAMDLIENEQNFVIRIDLPGLSPDDVNVEIENDMLTVRGEMGDTIEREGDRYHYRERTYGSFERSIRLSNTIDANNTDASFENGVLTITLAKRPEAQPKQITVKASPK